MLWQAGKQGLEFGDMMADIESLGYPLVFKAGTDNPAPPGLDVRGNTVAIRSEVRALTGMQKEALIYNGATGTTWRMVSDEGPYLNGTDLAPFPLAFFAAGMAVSFVNEMMRHAAATNIIVDQYRLTQENFYTMDGSAIRGDMIGGALPTKILVEVETTATPARIDEIVELAVRTSPAQVYMSRQLTNTFSLNHNDRAVEVSEVSASPHGVRPNPIRNLQAARPVSDGTPPDDIIMKLEAADTVFGIEGGAGSSLKSAQKRTLHVKAVCTPGPEELCEVQVQLLKPFGSTFRFLGDESNGHRAPSSLDYLAAGVGFCFMTQIGRYAQIVKLELKEYSIVQDTVFGIGPDSAVAEPVDTHTFLSTGEDDQAAQKILSMSERTCFLHAAMRGTNQTQVTVKYNGRILEG